MIIIGKLIKVAVWMLSMPFCVEMICHDGGRAAGLNRCRLSFGGCGEAALARAIDGI